MGMKINAELPLPAELKAAYPLSEEIIRNITAEMAKKSEINIRVLTDVLSTRRDMVSVQKQ